MRNQALGWLLWLYALNGFAGQAGGNAQPESVLLAAGDIAQCGVPGAALTAALIEKTPGVVLAVGDLAYPKGSSRDFERCFAPTWGKFKERILPAPGNHEYLTPGAAGYFEYFGNRAGEAGKSFYSVDLGQWHIVSLDSNIDAGPGSDQLRWLEQDLAESRHACVLAFWHHPRFSSGRHGNNAGMAAAWKALYERGASVVISGHDHNYERFAPLDATGRPDAARGIRSFVVGSGGAKLYDFGVRDESSEAWNGSSWGVLKLSLYPDRYTWEFVPAGEGKFRDSGSGRCVKP
ncbi:MAG: metallophosphoesterase [Pseudomonadota bacterium]